MNVQSNNYHTNIVFTVNLSTSVIRYMDFSRWSYIVDRNSKISLRSLWFSPRLY